MVFRTPSLEGLEVEDIVRHDVHVHVEWGSVVLVLQSQRDEGIGVFDAIDKVATALNHALVYQLLEGLFGYGVTQVVEELVPEARVDQVTRGVLCTTYVEVYMLPVVVILF